MDISPILVSQMTLFNLSSLNLCHLHLGPDLALDMMLWTLHSVNMADTKNINEGSVGARMFVWPVTPTTWKWLLGKKEN